MYLSLDVLQLENTADQLIGNERFYRQRYMGQLLADDHLDALSGQ
jgi:hypothetical protein